MFPLFRSSRQRRLTLDACTILWTQNCSAEVQIEMEMRVHERRRENSEGHTSQVKRSERMGGVCALIAMFLRQVVSLHFIRVEQSESTASPLSSSSHLRAAHFQTQTVSNLAQPDLACHSPSLIVFSMSSTSSVPTRTISSPRACSMPFMCFHDVWSCTKLIDTPLRPKRPVRPVRGRCWWVSGGERKGKRRGTHQCGAGRFRRRARRLA